ncbi:hypothetical protein H4S04_000165 [Coemansia sp. S16]|nr:hypothetical protein H4S04_000165 [Coemansia sp. S16]
MIVVAIADAMTALNTAYVKCKIIHGNISDLAIQYQEKADGVKRFLEGFGYASYAGGSPDATKAEVPEMMLSQSTRSLEHRFEEEIVAELLRIVEQHRNNALVALETTESPTVVRAEQSVGPLKKRK